jgi:two-component system, response regulator YesN
VYSLMIVDDEPLAQVGIKSMLDWSAIGVSVIGASPNGEQAFEAIGRLKPDIVITDVRMPLLDGLGLIERCRARMDDPPAFIVLTAYADFESARRSLRLSAVDFLVKIELDEATLRSSVERAKAIVDRGRRARDFPRGEESDGRPRPRALMRFLSGEYPGESEARAAFEAAGFRAMPGPACLAHAVAEFPFPERLAEEDKDRAFRCAKDMAVEIARREAAVIEGETGERAFSLVLSFGQDAGECPARARALLDGAAEMIEKYFGLSLAVGIAPSYDGIGGLPGAFHQARAEAVRKARAPGNDPIDGDVPPSTRDEAPAGNPLAAGVRGYVAKNICGKLALADVARIFRVSPNHLSTVFKKNSGIGFNEFVAKAKVEKAKELLLRGGHRMFEIAQALGFDDSFYFSKVFKRVTGLSPREFCLRNSVAGKDGASAGSP